MTILVIEDDSDCLTLIQRALGPLCDKLLHTDKLEDGLSLLSGGGIDAIWLDLALSDSRSDETVRRGIPAIRAICPRGTLIVVSGYGDSIRGQAISAGADAYATKNELNSFNKASIAALLIKAAVNAMQRGADAGRILERVTAFFSAMATSLNQPLTPQ